MVELMTLNIPKRPREAQRAQQRLQLRQRAYTPLLTTWPRDNAQPQHLGAPRHDELQLVWRGLRGDEAAAEQITALMRQELETIWSKRSTHASAKQEREQLLGQLLPLLFGAPSQQGKLMEYQGHGELRLWLRIVALRHIITSAR